MLVALTMGAFFLVATDSLHVISKVISDSGDNFVLKCRLSSRPRTPTKFGGT